jgi:putative hydrolase of the HAD superfamily
MAIELLALDADDTLWENERLFQHAQARLRALLSRYHAPEWVDQRLFATEMRNMAHYGYGIKAFTLSMIETAIELSEGRISAGEIMQIIDGAKGMLSAEIDVMPGVPAALEALARLHPLMLITKGDLRDQHDKLKRSGLAQFFTFVEVVANKRREDYARILTQQRIAPAQFMMVGNALKSDVLPVLALGAHAVWIHMR